MNPSDYTEIGQYLRESRESLRVSLPYAAQELNIRVKYLSALESGNLEELPGKAYVTGYIRTYAAFLRLDVDQVLGYYAPLIGPKTSDIFIPEPTLRQNLPGAGVIWLSLAGLVLLYIGWYFTHYRHLPGVDSVPDLPPNIAHLLDKPPVAGMNQAWFSCVKAGRAGCTVILKSQDLPDVRGMLYDIDYSDNAPEEP